MRIFQSVQSYALFISCTGICKYSVSQVLEAHPWKSHPRDDGSLEKGVARAAARSARALYIDYKERERGCIIELTRCRARSRPS